MKPLQFATKFERLLRQGEKISASKISGREKTEFLSGAPTAMIFSPHPDDECITGALALRLLKESKWNVLNVAVTLGSKVNRRKERQRELERACAALNFHLLNLKNSEIKNEKFSDAAMKEIADLLGEYQPRVIFLPHDKDVHPTHIATHLLVLRALKKMSRQFHCHVIETEFWGQMDAPNLLVESSARDVADLIGALACHRGEVRRNAYQARLPSWMADNVRRGAELIGGQGSSSPKFVFGTIYRWRKWVRGGWKEILKRGKFLSSAENAGKLFE